jgi:hypothetical protein
LDRILSFDDFVGELGSLEETSPKTLIDTEIGKAQWKDQRWGRPQKSDAPQGRKRFMTQNAIPIKERALEWYPNYVYVLW